MTKVDFFDHYIQHLKSDVHSVLCGDVRGARLFFAYPNDVFNIANELTNGEPFKRTATYEG